MLIMIPVSLVISAVCLIIIFFLIGNDKTPGIISPLAQTVGQNTGSVNSGENKIRDFLEKEKITFKNLIFIDSSYFKIILDDDREILISAGGDIRKELSSLQYILSRLTMEGREFARLDLRYEKPIIIFK